MGKEVIMDKIYFEEDKSGRHKVIEKPNGIKVRLLQEPSKWYKDKQAKRAAEDKIKQDAKKIVDDRERLIKDKMRELAIKELEQEGRL